MIVPALRHAHISHTSTIEIAPRPGLATSRRPACRRSSHHPLLFTSLKKKKDRTHLTLLYFTSHQNQFSLPLALSLSSIPPQSNTRRTIDHPSIHLPIHPSIMTATHRSVDEVNAIMVKYVPELDSNYARYPLKYDRWLKATETVTPSNQPCFIACGESDDNGKVVKPNYVYCKTGNLGKEYGNCGKGYYHVMTKIAYINLYVKYQSTIPFTVCGGCLASSEFRQKVDEMDDVVRIIYARSVARRPDDGVAAKDAILTAQGTASGNEYHHQTVF
jgi:hypothetical protein